MGRSIAESYIEKRIQQAQSDITPEHAAVLDERAGKYRADHAIRAARMGFPVVTAHHLFHEDDLPIYLKGIILAEAYAKDGLVSEYTARNYQRDERVTIPSSELAEFYQRLAKRSSRIAQGLARAAKRA